MLDGEEEVLTEEEKKEKEAIIKELTKRLAGPLADENGNVPTGKDRPIAIEVDGPSHFYANSKRYNAYTKLKHRLLTKMGYKVLHVPYFDWRRLRGAREREEYMRNKLLEEPTEWLDPEDEKYYNMPFDPSEEEVSYQPSAAPQQAPPTPPRPPRSQGAVAPPTPPTPPPSVSHGGKRSPPPAPPQPPQPPQAAAMPPPPQPPSPPSGALGPNPGGPLPPPPGFGAGGPPPPPPPPPAGRGKGKQ